MLTLEITKCTNDIRIILHQLNIFFAGLDLLHNLTSSRDYELRIDLQDFDNNTAYATYR